MTLEPLPVTPLTERCRNRGPEKAGDLLKSLPSLWQSWEPSTFPTSLPGAPIPLLQLCIHLPRGQQSWCHSAKLLDRSMLALSSERRGCLLWQEERGSPNWYFHQAWRWVTIGGPVCTPALSPSKSPLITAMWSRQVISPSEPHFSHL